VEARQGDGTYLKRPDSRLLPQAVEWGLLLGEHTTFDLIEARSYIEIALARLAAVRRDAAALERIRAQLERMAMAGDDRAVFTTADLEFHLRIADASGNAVLAGALDSIQSLLRVWMGRVSSAAPEMHSSYMEHVPIFEAIERGDPDGAAEGMEVHLGSATAKLAKTLNSSWGLDPSRRPAVVDSA
jgi:GntR family transcriptional repressor for pyruvate dehydrogenase complex